MTKFLWTSLRRSYPSNRRASFGAWSTTISSSTRRSTRLTTESSKAMTKRWEIGMRQSQGWRRSKTLMKITIRCQLWDLTTTTWGQWGCSTNCRSPRSRLRIIQMKSKISCTKDWLKSTLNVSGPRMKHWMTRVSTEIQETRDPCRKCSLELQAISWTPHLRVNPPRRAEDVSLKAGKTPK